jgi:hypothetical protein
MGLIAKQKTKARTASMEYVTNLSTNWIADGMPQMAAIVRAAASSVAARGSLRSSGFRGHDTLGIGSAMRSGESTVWVEQVGFGVWAIGLGLQTVKGPAFDWQLKVQTTRTESAVNVRLSTPAVLTKDGAQVHKDEYLEAREVVVTGLTASSPPLPDGEILAGACGLNVPPPPFDNSLGLNDGATFVMTTMLSRDAILGRLSQLQFARIPAVEADGRWHVGLQGVGEPSWVDLTIGDGGGGRELRFTVHLAEHENTATALVAARHASQLTTWAFAHIKSGDDAATMTGEEVALNATA